MILNSYDDYSCGNTRMIKLETNLYKEIEIFTIRSGPTKWKDYLTSTEKYNLKSKLRKKSD